MTIVPVAGNFTPFPPGFCTAMSVIISPLSSEDKSTWYKYIPPRLDKFWSNSRSASFRLGAEPVSIASVEFEFSSYENFAAACPLTMIYGVLSYRSIKLPPGIVLPDIRTAAESLTVVTLLACSSHPTCSMVLVAFVAVLVYCLVLKQTLLL